MERPLGKTKLRRRTWSASILSKKEIWGWFRNISGLISHHYFLSTEIFLLRWWRRWRRSRRRKHLYHWDKRLHICLQGIKVSHHSIKSLKQFLLGCRSERYFRRIFSFLLLFLLLPTTVIRAALWFTSTSASWTTPTFHDLILLYDPLSEPLPDPLPDSLPEPEPDSSSSSDSNVIWNQPEPDRSSDYDILNSNNSFLLTQSPRSKNRAPHSGLYWLRRSITKIVISSWKLRRFPRDIYNICSLVKLLSFAACWRDRSINYSESLSFTLLPLSFLTYSSKALAMSCLVSSSHSPSLAITTNSSSGLMSWTMRSGSWVM